MRNENRTIIRRIAAGLLVAVAVRSLVAVGWMLQIEARDGVPALALSLCQKQNPELGNWLSNQELSHAHHSESTNSPNSSIAPFENGCVLWLSSAIGIVAEATAILAIAPANNANVGDIEDARVHRVKRAHRSRAPPSFKV